MGVFRVDSRNKQAFCYHGPVRSHERGTQHGGVAELAYAADLKSAAARLVGSSPTTPTRLECERNRIGLESPNRGLEPMRWIRVKRTAQWAVRSESSEGVSPRSTERRRRAVSPTTPTTIPSRLEYKIIPLLFSPLL